MNSTFTDQFGRAFILARLKERAFKAWRPDDDSLDLDSFDPVIEMLLGGCAVEFEKLYHELNNSQNQIIKKLSNLLLPEVYSRAQPAHAIAHGRPLEPLFTINPAHQLLLRPIPDEHISHPIYFSPSGCFRLVNAQLRVISTPTSFVKISDNGEKKDYKGLSRGESLPYLWIGIAVHDKLDDFSSWSLYFSWPEQYNRKGYAALKHSNWFIETRNADHTNLQKVDSKLGLRQTENINNVQPRSWLENQFNLVHLTEVKANDFYNERFVHLDLTASGTIDPMTIKKSLSRFPSDFSHRFSKKDLNNLDEGLLWLQVTFNDLVSSEILENAFCRLNCFPVLNRRLNKDIKSIRNRLHWLKLKCNYSEFHAINRVYHGNFVYRHALISRSEKESGTYILRDGGVATFDSRDASELISLLIELLSDEASSFRALGGDASQLKEVSDLLDNISDEFNLDTINNSIFMRVFPRNGHESVKIEFWTTLGADANRIPAGSALKTYSFSRLADESLHLVTKSYGGRKKLDENKLVDRYRAEILSRGRIVTAEDIKAHCEAELDFDIVNIDIKKSFRISSSLNEGLERTIDIFISIKPNHELTADSARNLEKDLATALTVHSANLCPYRVFINSK